MNNLSYIHRWCNLKVLVASAAMTVTIAGASPQFLSQISDTGVESVYQVKTPFKFTSEDNEKFLTKLMGQLPMAKSASIISSSPPVDTDWVNSASLGYRSRNHKQVNIVAVTFQRTDYLPRLHFQVTTDWYECEVENQNCSNSVTYNVLGPTETVTLLKDFSSYPKALNSFTLSLQLQNVAGSSRQFSPNPDTAATATWNFAFRGSGYEDYIRYFRTKLNVKDQTRVGVSSIESAVGLWTGNVSRSIFN